MAKVDSSQLLNPIEKHFNVLGRYHYYFFFLLFLSKVPLFWHTLGLVFITPPMEFSCMRKGNKSSTSLCPCEDPVWDTSVFTKTVQTKYDLSCDRDWLISFSQSMLYLGTLCGALIFGFLSDRFGRLSMFVLCCLITATGGCLVIVMPTITSFIIMRCIEGIGVGGAIVTSYVLLVEYCGVNYREPVSALFHVPLNIGHCSMAGISYILRDCDQFQLATSVPVFLIVAYKWLILETPKWLMAMDKIDEAALVMEKVFKFNKLPSDSIKDELIEYNATIAKNTRHKIKFWQIFRHKQLSINFACMSFIYFVCGMGYYGVSQYIGNMSGDIHMNIAISGALLLPGTIASVFLLKILNRRPFLMATTFMSGLLMLIVVFVPADLHWVRVVIACICNCFFFMSFIIVFLYGVELFPTSVRNSVLGVLSVISRLGQIVAPPINSLPQYASGVIFGVMALISAALCYPLPETKNVELPSSLEDSKTLPHKRLSLTS